MRITPQRTTVYAALTEADDHPTAEAVYKRVRKKMPNISYDTVNRTLLSFVEIGVLKMVQSRGSAKRFDPELEQHHHFQCLKCNRIIDFKYENYNQLKLPPHLPKGTRVLDKKVVLEGICENCRG
ncbi:transcriptional repressor [candidate division FCPU426 bacterium]|nr:transcriptional repressor [candidate division FCPU426 bacterium]